MFSLFHDDFGPSPSQEPASAVTKSSLIHFHRETFCLDAKGIIELHSANFVAKSKPWGRLICNTSIVGMATGQLSREHPQHERLMKGDVIDGLMTTASSDTRPQSTCPLSTLLHNVPTVTLNSSNRLLDLFINLVIKQRTRTSHSHVFRTRNNH